MAEQLRPLLQAAFGSAKLLESAQEPVGRTDNQLAASTDAPQAGRGDARASASPECATKRVSEPLTPAQVRDRREILRQQVATVTSRRSKQVVGSVNAQCGESERSTASNIVDSGT